MAAVERRSIRQTLAAARGRDDKQTQANRLMVAKLQELAANDKITNDYDVEFLNNVEGRINRGEPLTTKQQEHLDLISHHRY